MNANDAIVSIIMPVYNAAEFLEESVGDVLTQTFGAFELVCVDDGSTDGSGDILDGFALKDDRVIVIHQENRGGGAARNVGIELAKGKYILFLDADDRFESKLLELSVKKAEDENAEVCVYNADVFDYQTGERRAAPWLIKSGSLSEENPFETINNTAWNKLFLKQFIDRCNIRFTERRAAYSTSFVALSIILADRITLLNDVLLHYRVNNPNSNIKKEDKDPTAILDAMLEIRQKLVEKKVFWKYRKKYACVCAQELISRVNLMRTFEGAKALYDRMHDGGIEKLFERVDDDKPLDDAITPELKIIRDVSFDKWLYSRIDDMKRFGVLSDKNWIIPIRNSDEIVRIAVYGGGSAGKDFFFQAMRRSDIKIVCWADRNYERIGFPLQSPEVLKEAEYDILLIAVSDRKTADIITKDLLTMGIPEDKIFWEQPEYI